MNKLIISFLCFLSLPAMAAVSIEVMETYPKSSVEELAVDQSFYVRLRYSSDTPVRIYVRPNTLGKDTIAISSSSVLLPVGTGETLGWFALRNPGVVDEYQISIDTKNSGYPELLESVPVTLTWKPGGIISDSDQPDWIARLNKQNETLRKAEMANAPKSSHIPGMLIMLPLFGVPVLAIALSIIAFIRWEGGWRYAGGLPLVFFGLWAVNVMIAVARDPTSHNLWPFEMLYWAAYTLIWLVVLFIARKLLVRA